MKALTLWQPWASAVVAGLKYVEFRDWPTSYQGLLAIHAAKRKVDSVSACGDLCEQIWQRTGMVPGDLPLGAIVGAVYLDRCVDLHPVNWNRSAQITDVLKAQDVYGYSDDSKFGWFFTRYIQFSFPIPKKGMQRLWNTEVDFNTNNLMEVMLRYEEAERV